MSEVAIPEHIDSQAQFFMWEIDEFVIGSGIFIVGIVLRHIIPALILGWLAVRAIRRWKEDEMDGALLHIVYGMGMTALNSVFNDGMKNEFWL